MLEAENQRAESESEDSISPISGTLGACSERLKCFLLGWVGPLLLMASRYQHSKKANDFHHAARHLVISRALETKVKVLQSECSDLVTVDPDGEPSGLSHKQCCL